MGSKNSVGASCAGARAGRADERAAANEEKLARRQEAARLRSEEPAATTAFKAKMQTEEAKAIYSERSRIAEFPHAWIKERCRLRQFRRRGRLKASMEATWAALSYNLSRC